MFYLSRGFVPCWEKNPPECPAASVQRMDWHLLPGLTVTTSVCAETLTSPCDLVVDVNGERVGGRRVICLVAWGLGNLHKLHQAELRDQGGFDGA